VRLAEPKPPAKLGDPAPRLAIPIYNLNVDEWRFNADVD
jgi:hypothetical protein